MFDQHIYYLPLSPLFFLLLVGAALALIVLIQIRVLSYAYHRLGVSSGAATLLLVGSLIGSYVNIPIYQLPAEHLMSAREVWFFGMPYVVPVARDAPGTTVAINVGGAVIPILLSLYLMARNDLWILGAIATAVVAFVCHMVAEPVPGVGIAEPIFTPPLASAIVSLVLSRRYAAPLAYVSGSLGALIGADLLNIDKIQGLGAPVASIGGAGTYDGVFLTGVLAVLIASLSGAPAAEQGQARGR